MSIITIQKCPLCNSINIEPDFFCIDYLVTKKKFEVYVCRQCSFLFTNNFPSNHSIDKYYDKTKHIAHSDIKKSFINKLYHLVRSHMVKRKLKLVCNQSKKKTGKILDIGCGTGHFLNEAKRKGWETFGTEKNERAIKFAIESFNIFVKPEHHIYKFPKASFDVITLWHVLEYMEDISEIMEKIYDLLLPDGIVVIAVPNHNSYDAKHYQIRWAGYDIPRHLWHFTPKTMELFVNKFKFNIIHKSTMPFDTFYVSLLSEKYKKTRGFIAFVSAMFTGAVSNINALFDKNKGSSIIYVLKKADHVSGSLKQGH